MPAREEFVVSEPPFRGRRGAPEQEAFVADLDAGSRSVPCDDQEGVRRRRRCYLTRSAVNLALSGKPVKVFCSSSRVG